MKPEVRARYTPDVRAGVARAAGGAPDALADVGGFESFVHELVVDGAPRIIKATWSGRRSAEAVQAELDFVSWLADHDAPVCRPLPLRGDALLETVPCEGGGWHVTAWEKAPGTNLPRADFTPEAFRPWGALAGTFHRLAAEYRAARGPDARPTWEEELDGMALGEHNEPDMIEQYVALRDRIQALPREPVGFGPMHADLHHGNIHWHEGAMRVFDFEDMIDYWFVADLAVILFHSIRAQEDVAEVQRRYDAFAPALFEGYASTYELPRHHRDALALFAAEREQVMRAVILRSIPPEDRAEHLVRFVEASGARIRAGEPALGIRW